MLLAIIIFVCSGHLYGQELKTAVTNFFGVEDCSLVAADAAACADKGMIITATCNCMKVKDTVLAKNNVVVAKLDSNMQLQWLKTYGGSSNDEGRKICLTSDGGYAVLATSESGDGDVSVTGQGKSKGLRDIWLIRLDAAGNILWSKTYGGNGDDEAVSIAVKPDGGFLIMGASTAAGNDIPSHYSTSTYLYDWFVLSTDASGNKQWLKVYGGNDDESVSGSILIADSGYYLVGDSKSTDHNCKDTSWHQQGQYTSHDAYIMKLDTAGNVVWSKSYGGYRTDAVHNAMLDHSDNSIVVVGSSLSDDHMAKGNRNSDDLWIFKAGTDGEFKWAKMYGGVDREYNPAICKTAAGHYLVYTNTYSSRAAANEKGSDTWLFVLDTAGNLLADRVVGGAQNDIGVGVIATDDGIYAIGTTMSQRFKDDTSQGFRGNAENIFLSKLNYQPTGVSKVDISFQLRIYPNPVNDAVTVELPANCQSGNLQVLNSVGQKVYSKRYEKHLPSIVLSAKLWSSGSYQLIWHNEDGTNYYGNILKQ